MSAQVLETPVKFSSESRAKVAAQSVRAGQVAAMLRDIQNILTELQAKGCPAH